MPAFKSWLAAATAIGMCLGAAVPAPSTEDIQLLKEKSLASDVLFPVLPCGKFKLEEATIDQMQAAMEAGTLTSVQLVGCYVLRTFQTDLYIKYVPSNLRIEIQVKV